MELSDICFHAAFKKVQDLTEICLPFVFLIKSFIYAWLETDFLACWGCFFFSFEIAGCLYTTVLTSLISGRSKRLFCALAECKDSSF